jgi:hypothetical protein
VDDSTLLNFMANVIVELPPASFTPQVRVVKTVYSSQCTPVSVVVKSVDSACSKVTLLQ